MKKTLLFILTFSFLSLKAQQKVEIAFHFSNNEPFPKNITQKTNFQNKTKALKNLEILMHKLYSNGFIEASLDSVVEKAEILNAYIFLGKQYYLSNLENGNLSNEVLKKIGFKEKEYLNTKFSFNEINNIELEVLSYYENRGFPFAEVYLDSFFIENQKITSKIYAKPHSLYTIDTIVIEGNTRTKSRFLQNYLGIKRGDLFNKAKIDKINQKIAQLSFVETYKDVKLVFVENKVKIHVFINKQKSNEFNFLLGILPNDKLKNRKVTITGDGKLNLLNSFGVGEEILVDFKQLKPKTQNLDIEFTYPFFLNLPLGVNGSFNLFKNDTSYIDINTKAGIIYPFNGADFLQIFYQNQISNVLNYDTNLVRLTKQLPKILDRRNNSIGIKMNFQQLDYIFNHRKGYKMTYVAMVGTKKIKKNSILSNIESNIYENNSATSVNFNLGFDLDYYIPLLKRHSIMIRNNSKFYISKNILENENFRIGGSKLLRGFDEEEIHSPYFSVFTLEYHFSLSKNAYFYTFGDMGLVEDSRFGIGKIDVPFGFGVGTTFETKAGIFSLSYALGKQLDNKIEIKNGKIHFGYINLF